MSKTLFIVITDSGDGSNGLGYTFDADLISLMEDNQDELGDSYQSGDGLQVRHLQVPDECTYESLGISKYSILDRKNYAFAQEAIKIVFVIDESGSMGSLQSDVIGGFNKLIDDQLEVEGAAEVTLITFANTVKTVLDNVDIEQVDYLTNESYRPSGGTAMNDAIGTALTKVLREAPEKAIINIFTDGYENVSREFQPHQVKELVQQAEAKGYQVVFLAANIDEVAVGHTFGLAKGATRAFAANSAGLETAYLQASAATTAYRTGGIQ
ncbi:von Willebrand factor type A domain protein [Pseudomonas phage VCM]|uniref:von Willebrand factor type A domain protein n=1 Tax=Pseudomonas phage VCM TaxID=1729937 RepID=A0A0S4L165_9CAUD|nr:von Willebrand factor type A domain protein [Pseudomonas phage VCM]CUR44281.1 von Willebrand factor type A domain protein [Pseudomonas phage VCM]